MQFYTDKTRESDPHALPDADVYQLISRRRGRKKVSPGWYWRACFPGCLPDGEPNGPFETKSAAIEDAQEGSE